ncbi:MAG: Multidrug resistance protein MdtC [Ignavibacteria bacterium]|nr:Multidrug resistance protein MdtC [Ignavibacteria bacterium]
MLDKIISFSIKNKLIVGLFTVALIIWGIISSFNLRIDALPDITNNQVQIITLSPSLAAQEVEKFITYPIEQSVKSTPRIVELRSISRFGLSQITVVFEESADIYWARAQINERLKEAEEQIPEGMGIPELAPISTGLGEIYQYVVYAEKGFEDKYDAMSLRTVQDWIIKPQLIGIPGVAEVNTLGGNLKEYEISVSPNKLNSMNATISEVFDALERNNENTGGAYIDKKPYAYFIRSIGMVRGIDDIKKIVVKNVNGIPVIINDLAEVKEGSAIRYGAVTKDGKGEVVSGMVMMLKGENSSAVVSDVKERIEKIKTTLPEGVKIEPFLDRTKLISKTIKTVETNLIEGALIVIFILVLLIGNMRAGLIVASVIPLSMLFAISMMNLFGVSGNLMSLGAIDFGLIIDGAVIIVEAIMHKMKNLNLGFLSRKQMDREVKHSSSKIIKSASFGIIIILIVYIPIFTLVGIEGKMFKPMAETVSFAILGAFLLSITYVPMMSSLFLNRHTGNIKQNISDKIMNLIHKAYKPSLSFAFKWKKIILIASLLIFALSVYTYKNMGGEFIPTLDEGDIATHVISSPGSSLSQEITATTKSEKVLMENFPEVLMTVSKIGSAEIPTDPMPMEVADVMVIMKDKDEWTTAKDRNEMMKKMENKLNDIPGITLEFTQPVQMRFNELMTGVRSDVAVKIFGDDIDLLSALSDEVLPVIQSVKGVEDARVEQVKGLPQIVVRYNPDKLALYGINVGDVNKILRTAFAGEKGGVVYEGEKRFDLVVRLEESSRNDISDVKSLFISLPGGNQIPLEQIADVNYEQGVMQISREEGKRRIVIGFNVRGRDVKSAVDEIQQKLNQNVKLPPGYYFSYGGQFQNLVEANKRLSLAVPAALVLIFILLFFAFNSVKQCLLIYTAIPLSAIGGVFALWLRGMPFSISAGVGFIALFGVAVLNGIVLISYFNQLKSEGMSDVLERIKEGTKVRLRPVIITASVASFGFLPMALSTSAGAEVQKPLATVVIGGLISATLLTLIILPILYYYFEEKIKIKNVKMKTTILILFFIQASAFAQSGDTMSVDLKTALKYASDSNPALQSAQLNIESNKKMESSYFDLPKTEIEFMYGQFSSINNDNNFTITQSIPFPSVFSSQKNLYEAVTLSSELGFLSAKSEIYYKIHVIIDKIKYLSSINKEMMILDSLYKGFVNAAELRYNVGEANLLEKVTANTKYGEIKQLIEKNKMDLLYSVSELKSLMNYGGNIKLTNDELQPKTLMAVTDTALINNNPILKNLYQQVTIADRSASYEAAKNLPDFKIGYFNQSLVGNQEVDGNEVYYDRSKRFTGFNIGISIPVTFFSSSAKVKSLELQKKSVQRKADSEKLFLENQLKQAYGEYLKNYSAFNYFTQTALPNSELIIKSAKSSYEVGEIGYIEYNEALETYADIRLNYLDIIFQLNQSVINVDYLTGNIR